VGSFLEQLSAHVADLQQRLAQAEETASGMEKELSDAKSAEEAVRLTMMAATQAKEEILSTANKEAAEVRKAAGDESEAVRRSAQDEADRILNESRREALTTLETSRRDAEEMIAAARAENENLVAESAGLHQAIEAARASLSALANGALAELSEVSESLPPMGEEAIERPPMSVVPDPEPTSGTVVADPAMSDSGEDGDAVVFSGPLDDFADGGEVVLLPDAVDRLLSQLRDANS
jgi:cell division septum initiation protein DivIVA